MTRAKVESRAAPVVLTIGHSNHAAEDFVRLLRLHGVRTVGDVRSMPYSRRNPQFNRETLAASLTGQGIGYEYLGEYLGARSSDPACYVDGRVQFDRLAATRLFQAGLSVVVSLARRSRLALMCAEKDPRSCHRSILIARHLTSRSVPVEHILADGAIMTHREFVEDLMARLKLPEPDMFRGLSELIDEAYRLQGERIAYSSN